MSWSTASGAAAAIRVPSSGLDMMCVRPPTIPSRNGSPIDTGRLVAHRVRALRIPVEENVGHARATYLSAVNKKEPGSFYSRFALGSGAMAVEIESLGPAEVDPRAQQHMVPMRDGVELAIDVYLPDGPGPWPAVLVRLPYDKNGRYCWMPFISRHFTERGYAFLPQDVRGKFRSGGETNAFVHEIDDGYDTIEWITRQPWADGDVGHVGDSYYGFTQWAAVASGHPALRAIVPRVTVADLFDWLDGVTPLYGAHYMAEFWSTTAPPLHSGLDAPAPERGVRRSLRGDRLAVDRV